jgi:hypothetical protein
MNEIVSIRRATDESAVVQALADVLLDCVEGGRFHASSAAAEGDRLLASGVGERRSVSRFLIFHGRLFRRDLAALVDRDLHGLAGAHGRGGPTVASHRDFLELGDFRESLAGELLPDLVLRHLADIAALLRARDLGQRSGAERERANERQLTEFRNLHFFLPDEPR